MKNCFTSCVLLNLPVTCVVVWFIGITNHQTCISAELLLNLLEIYEFLVVEVTKI